MKSIELPVMASSTDLVLAVDKLKRANRGALIAEENGRYHLYTAGSIVVGRAKGKNRLSDLLPEHTLAVGDRLPQVVLERVTGSLAGLEISHDDVAQRYVSSPRDYYCDGPRHHEFPPPSVSEGEDCPYLDGYTIVSNT
jgi:hypothetical protein